MQIYQNSNFNVVSDNVFDVVSDLMYDFVSEIGFFNREAD